MASITEAAGTALPPAGALLDDGIKSFLYQEVEFTRYVRVILPLDGFAFWVRAGLLSDTAILDAGITDSANTFTTTGAIHFMATQGQEEDTTNATNNMVFTTTSELCDFNGVSKNEIYIGSFEGIRFAFNTQGMLSPNTKLFHYTGIAILPIMQSQIIDNADDIDVSSLIVSNSLPIWMAMSGYTKKSWERFSSPVALYPSFLVPTNLNPPYGVVHNQTDTIAAISAAPTVSANGSRSQFVTEKVRVTLYGLNNNKALDFVDFVRERCDVTGSMGITNAPVPRDDKLSQSELSVLAQKKLIDFEVNFYQSRVMDVALQLITSAVPTFTVRNLAP